MAGPAGTWMCFHPLAEHGAVFFHYAGIAYIHCQIHHLAPVCLHVVKLFTILALVIKDVFVLRSAYHPAESAGSLVEIRLSHDIVTQIMHRITGFSHFPDAEARPSFRHLGSCPVTDSRHEGRHTMKGMFATSSYRTVFWFH